MGILGKLFGRKKVIVNDALKNAFVNYTVATCKNGCDTDEIPGGRGEFGLCVTNPVPVKSIIANKIYLGKLRTANNEKVTWERIGSMHAANIQSPIDAYRIFDSTGEKITTIYISPYHRKISNKAPKGFRLVENKDEG